MARAFWFAVGTGAGIYGTVKARRVAYRLSPEGLADQAAAVGLGLRALAADVREAMTEREDALLSQLGLPRREEGGPSGHPVPPGTATPTLAPGSPPVRREVR